MTKGSRTTSDVFWVRDFRDGPAILSRGTIWALMGCGRKCRPFPQLGTVPWWGGGGVGAEGVRRTSVSNQSMFYTLVTNDTGRDGMHSICSSSWAFQGFVAALDLTC